MLEAQISNIEVEFVFGFWGGGGYTEIGGLFGGECKVQLGWIYFILTMLFVAVLPKIQET